MQSSPKRQENWEHQQFFPTRVIHSFYDDSLVIEELKRMFSTEARFHDKEFLEVADGENLIHHAHKYPSLENLKNFMWDGMRSWMKAEGIEGKYKVKTHMFSNYSKKGAFVPAHNHVANLSGVYYIDVPDFNRNSIFLQGEDKEYWAQDQGVLILHDPRFNASLVDLRSNNYVKVFPRAGMGIIFPSYLWHSVTSHYYEQDRISIAFNFQIQAVDSIPMPEDELEL